MGIGIWQLIILLVIIVLVFGTKKLKNMGSDLGGAMKGFKKAINENEQTDNIEEGPEGRIIEGSAEHEHVETKVSEKEKS